MRGWGQPFASRTYTELAALTADIHVRLTGAQPPRKPARPRARPPVSKVVLVGACVVIPPAAPVAAFLTGSEQLAQIVHPGHGRLFYGLAGSRGPDVRHMAPDALPRAAAAAASAAEPGARRRAGRQDQQ